MILQLRAVDREHNRAEFETKATNWLGQSRSIAIALYIPHDEMLHNISVVPIGTTVEVEAEDSRNGAPCAMTMIAFSEMRPKA